MQARLDDLERQNQELADQMRRRENTPDGQIYDPNSGRQMAVEEVLEAARNPQHVMHGFALLQVESARALQQERQARIEAEQYADIPREHIAAVKTEYEKVRGKRFSDPRDLYEAMKGRGVIKPSADDVRKEDERVSAERRAQAPALPNPGPVPPGGNDTVPEIKRSDYLRRLKDEPHLREQKDTNKLIVVND